MKAGRALAEPAFAALDVELRGQDLERRHLHLLPAARSAARQQPQQRAGRGVDGRQIERQRLGRRDRRTFRRPDQAHQATQGEHDRARGAVVRVRPARADSRQAGDDQTGVQLAQALGRQPEPRQERVLGRVHEHVRPADQVAHDRVAVG
jgi:hypothetical protein